MLGVGLALPVVPLTFSHPCPLPIPELGCPFPSSQLSVPEEERSLGGEASARPPLDGRRLTLLVVLFCR